MPSHAPPTLSAADYEAIAAAVKETSRGRWFLDEYARRNRHADTHMLLRAMARLESAMRSEDGPRVCAVRCGLIDMADAIARAKADIATLEPECETRRIGQATEELDLVVGATEIATSEILAAAEHVQEIAWTLREQGLPSEQCDALDARATDIYTACSFQDLTGQRTRKVIQLLRYLEARIAALIDMAGKAAPASPAAAERALLNGPARTGEGLAQADVDAVMGSTSAGTSAIGPDAPPLQPAACAPDVPAGSSEWRPDRRYDPLAPLAAMTEAEKIALFT